MEEIVDRVGREPQLREENQRRAPRMGVTRHLYRARDIEGRIGDAHRRRGDRDADEAMRMKAVKGVGHDVPRGLARIMPEAAAPVMPRPPGRAAIHFTYESNSLFLCYTCDFKD